MNKFSIFPAGHPLHAGCSQLAKVLNFHEEGEEHEEIVVSLDDLPLLIKQCEAVIEKEEEVFPIDGVTQQQAHWIANRLKNLALEEIEKQKKKKKRA